MRTIEINAEGQVLGRLASKIALILQGKDQPSFEARKECDSIVKVSNVSKVKITGKKLEEKEYKWYTGYPGGLKRKKVGEVFEKNPAWVLKHAILGMLPKNKLRAKRIKKLIIC